MSLETKLIIPNPFFMNIKDSGEATYSGLGLEESNKHLLNSKVVTVINAQIADLNLLAPDFSMQAASKVALVYADIMTSLSGQRFKDALFIAGLIESLRAKIITRVGRGELTPTQLKELEEKTIDIVYKFIDPTLPLPAGFPESKEGHRVVFHESIASRCDSFEAKLEAAKLAELARAKALEAEINALITNASSIEAPIINPYEDGLKLRLNHPSIVADEETYLSGIQSGKEGNFFSKLQEKKAKLTALKENLLRNFSDDPSKLEEIARINLPIEPVVVSFRTYEKLKKTIQEFASLKRGHLYLPQLIQELKQQGKLEQFATETGILATDLEAAELTAGTIASLKAIPVEKPSLLGSLFSW